MLVHHNWHVITASRDPDGFRLRGLQPAGGAGAGGGGGQGGPLDFLRSNPQFQGLRNIVRSNPQILQPMLQVSLPVHRAVCWRLGFPCACSSS